MATEAPPVSRSLSRSFAALEAWLASRRGLAVLWLVSTVSLAVVALLMSRAGLRGWDDAAHVYKVYLLEHGSSIFWDDYWYGGSYGAVTYGFIFYWLAQYVPAKVIVVLAGGTVPLFYYLYQRGMWHIADVWPAWLLAGVMGTYLAHGQDPFVLALALTMGGLALLAAGHPLWAALPVSLGIFANPMGLVIGAIFMLADFLGRPEVRRRYLVFFAAMVPAAAARVLVGWAFSEPGAYLNQTSQLLLYLGFALFGLALSGINAVHPRRPFAILFLVYAVVCLGSFVMPGSPLGNNIGRFFMVFAIPLLFLLRTTGLRRPLPHFDLAMIAIVCFAVLQFSTPYSHFTDHTDLQQTKASFFAPALTAAAQLHDTDHRIHVVALRRHWEAYYFPAAGYAITRGWYRQADAVHNSLFYTLYGPDEYVRWLRSMGVRYVFLPSAQVDAWSRREVHILKTSPRFRVVERTGSWTIYRLLDDSPLAVPVAGQQGVAQVTAMEHLAVAVKVSAAGDYLLKVTWSPYWRLEEGSGRLRRGPGRFIVLHAQAPGTYRLRLVPSLDVALGQVAGHLGL